MTSISALRLRQVDAGLQPGDDLRVVILADCARGVGIRERHPDIASPSAPHDATEKRRGHHADDRVGLAVERERATDDVRRAAEMASSRTDR